MAEFRNPSRGGNLVHRLELPGLGRSGRSGGSRRRAGRRGREGESRERLAAYIVPAPAPEEAPAPREIVREVVREVVKAPAASPEDAALADSQARRQIGVLERRLAKMAKLLDQRDVEMLSRSRREQAEDAGVASIYREVQGLDDQGDEGKQKKALMSSIFEANLKLREMVTSAPQDAD